MTSLRIACGLLALCLLAPARAEPPQVALDIPADAQAPVVAQVQLGKHSYRLLVDTGASDLYLDPAQAHKLLRPLPPSGDANEDTAAGLYGEIALQRFASPPTLSIGNWQTHTGGHVYAADMAAAIARYGLDGVIGTRYLSRLNWIWDNRAGKLSGYAPGSAALASARDGLACVDMYSSEGIPQVVLEVTGDPAPFLLDTGDLNASGSLSEQDRVALEYRGAVDATAYSALQHSDAQGRDLGALQMTRIRGVLLGTQPLDGLVLHEAAADSRLGRAFFSKFDRLVLDFEGMRLCFAPRPAIDRDAIEHY